MPEPTRTHRLASRGNQAVHRWTAETPTHLVLLAHGIAEHARRYDPWPPPSSPTAPSSWPPTTTVTASPTAGLVRRVVGARTAG